MLPKYVYHYLELQYEATRRIASGNNQPALNKSRVQELTIPIPPLAEQERIVAEIERRLSVLDQLDAAVTANLKRADALRQSVLRRAFSGQLVPQDPAQAVEVYRSASALGSNLSTAASQPPLL